MKKAVLMVIVLMTAPILALAQSRWSVSPAVGFYKAELDGISDDLKQLENFGASVQKPNGSVNFGGRVHYQKSPRWSWLAEVSYWQDKGGGNLQGAAGMMNFEDQVRLVPIMFGSQYYFSQPQSKSRLYAGATGGLVLVTVKSEFSLNAPGANPFSDSSSRSGNDFVTRPFVGVEVANTSKMSFWGELGYVFGKYTLETTADGVKTTEDISINGLHLTGGVKFSL